MAFCKRINVLKYDAEVTAEPFGQYSSRRTPLRFQKMVAKILPADGFSLNFHSADHRAFSPPSMGSCIPASNNAATSYRWLQSDLKKIPRFFSRNRHFLAITTFLNIESFSNFFS